MGVDAMEWIVHRQVASDDPSSTSAPTNSAWRASGSGVDVAGVFEVHDGKITLWRDYFDMNAMTEAITTLAGGGS